MKRTKVVFVLLSLFTLLSLQSCKKDKDLEPAKTGKLQGVVKDAVSAALLADVSILVFNADNNSPTGVVLKTNASGEYITDLPPGNYFVKFFKQGYDAV